MTKEELWNEAKIRVDAFIDNFSQDIRSTLYDRLNQEDVKDFLYGLYIDSAEPREKKIEELEESNRELQKLVQQREQRGLEVQEDLLKEKKELEKENRLLGERCNQLLKDKGNLTDRLEELQEQNSEMFNTIALQEQQIEKMKADVKQEQSYWNSGEMQYGLFQRLLDKWEIRK